MNKVKSFIKQFVAVVNGDNAEALAQKTYRQADAHLESEIAVQKGKLVDKVTAVEVAEEDVQLARVNHGKPISNRESYLQSLKSAKEALLDAKEAQTEVEELIKFFTSEKEALNAEVDA